MAFNGRRASLGKGTVFSSRLDANDSAWNEVRITSCNYAQSIVTCNLVKVSQNAGGSVDERIDAFSGGIMVRRNNRVVAVVRDVFYNKVNFKIIIKGHDKDPDRDHVIIKTNGGFKALRDQIDNLGDSNSGGTPDDPDAEAFVRVGAPTGPIVINAGTTGNQAGGIQPGTVVVKTAANVIHAYDHDGQLIKFDDPGPVYVPIGTVDYGSGGNWKVVVTGGAFTGSVDAMKVM